MSFPEGIGRNSSSFELVATQTLNQSTSSQTDELKIAQLVLEKYSGTLPLEGRVFLNAKRLALKARQLRSSDLESQIQDKTIEAYKQAIKAYKRAVKLLGDSDKLIEGELELKVLRQEKNRLVINALAQLQLPTIEIKNLKNHYLNNIEEEIAYELQSLAELTEEEKRRPFPQISPQF